MTEAIDAHIHHWVAGPKYDAAQVELYRTLSRAAGIGHSLQLGSVGEGGAYPTVEQLRVCNDQTMALVRDFPDLFSGLVYVNPSHAQNALDEINRCVRDGNLCGIKLWVSNKASDPRVFPVVELAIKLDIGILQHTWNKTVQQGADESMSKDVVELARRYPEMRMQVAHLTGINFWGVLDLAPFPNVILDTSGGQPQSGLVEHAVRHLGADRVIYGSDWPIRDLPCQIARVNRAAVSAGDKKKILRGNAVRFWKIPDAAAKKAVKASGKPAVQVPEINTAPVVSKLVDVNAWFGPYPSGRHFPGTVARLEKALIEAGVTTAHVAPTEAIFGHEPAEDCLRLAGQLEGSTRLKTALCLRANQPVDVRRLPELVQKTGARILHLLPAYHGYAVDAPCVVELVKFARELGLLCAVHVRLEDRRCTDPRLLTEDVPLDALVRLAKAVEPLPLLALNAFGPDSRQLLKDSSNILCDLSMIESGNTLPDQCKELPAEQVYPRLVFGSHASFLYPWSVAAKLTSPLLDAAQREALAAGNFERVMQSFVPTATTAPVGAV
ncbi:MAG TPA: amidohydrolase family protein [Planctomycetota bacterium]|nr:amidohydrolase family protein [Planctomycetota bacterium]